MTELDVADHELLLRLAAEQYRKAVADVERTREALVEMIRQADRADVRQVDILRATNHVWTREQVRRVCRPAKDG